MSTILRAVALAILILLLDWYFFQAVKHSIRHTSSHVRTLIVWLYWGCTACTVALIALPFAYPYQYWSQIVRVYGVSIIFILTLSKITGSCVLLLEDVSRLLRWTWQKLVQSFRPHPKALLSGTPIPRKQFVAHLALITAAAPLSSLLYGMARGAFHYTVHRATIVLPHLPQSFNGLRIVQISDLHIGSFISQAPLEQAWEIIRAQNPDIIFFTGDLVNNFAEEIDSHLSILKQLHAPYGVFSVIGNHDYGDYVRWESDEAKCNNFQRLQALQQDCGWQLLMNDHAILERNGDYLAILGVEHWGTAMNFPKRGNLAQAYKGTEHAAVKLLLSHDPSHWDAQIRPHFPDIDITFSGHTHGAQFGIEIPGFRWSPAQYVYKQWAGLYRQGKQYLYVNRGLGFIGYPGRVGIAPEITVVELFKA